MKKLVIKKEKWLRGWGDKESMLRDLDGHMCCLGFLALDIGFKTHEIENLFTPAGTERCDLWPKDFFYIDGNLSALVDKIMGVNDESLLNDEGRIEELKPLFEKIGYEIVLED